MRQRLGRPLRELTRGMRWERAFHEAKKLNSRALTKEQRALFLVESRGRCRCTAAETREEEERWELGNVAYKEELELVLQAASSLEIEKQQGMMKEGDLVHAAAALAMAVVHCAKPNQFSLRRSLWISCSPFCTLCPVQIAQRERERETKRWDTDRKVTKAQKAKKMQATLKEKTHTTAIQFQCFCFKFLQNQEMGHQGKEEETRNNTTQRLFFLFIKHRKNPQTKISPNVGFFGRDSFYSQGGKKSSEADDDDFVFFLKNNFLS
jgi:hypothetical protein